MATGSARSAAISAVVNYKSGGPNGFAEEATGDLFNANVFSKAEMKKRLPKDVFKTLSKTIEKGEKLDCSTADIVAAAMKDWALDNGATHYAHVFYPLTGLTAEKHDSFLSPDGEGGALAEFSGKQLIQGEPDGSSFPTGGIRVTFEARGYTIWDVTSPAYLLENANGTTLCIPTAFVSWSGEALDKKTPVLRSMQALNKQAQRILKLFGHTDGALVSSTAGPEQEYFLIDRHFYFARPDLLTAGRTLFGAKPPKGQEFDDHYFGAIPDRVLAFMLEAERELFKLGIPCEDPAQRGRARDNTKSLPIFEIRKCRATDHQQLMMATLKKVAEKYGMAGPLARMRNPSLACEWKRENTSIFHSVRCEVLRKATCSTRVTHRNENAQFLLDLCAAMIQRSAYRWSKGSFAIRGGLGKSNDHRLGANEAPPAILSVFLGRSS